MPPALLALVVCLCLIVATAARIGHARQAKARAGGAPADPRPSRPDHWSDRRGSERRAAARAPVYVSDDLGQATCAPAKVLDRSDAGLCLELGAPVPRDTALWVRRQGDTAWRRYRVCWCKRDVRAWHVGLAADPDPPTA